jgi:CRISPR/Cas system-associated endonuclease Cas1
MTMWNTAFLADVQFFGQHTRPCINEDDEIANYSASRETAQKSLYNQYNNRQFAVLRHRQNLLIAKEIQSKSIANEFLARSNEEWGHADLISERLVCGSRSATVEDGLTSGTLASSRSTYEYVKVRDLWRATHRDLRPCLHYRPVPGNAVDGRGSTCAA